VTDGRAQALLTNFLVAQTRHAVVRISDRSDAERSLFTGFFISPEGHLVTAFHAVKAHAFDLPCEFDLRLESDVGVSGSGDAMPPHIVDTTARCEVGWCDPIADWAVLRVDTTPKAFLPVSHPHALDRAGDPLCAAVRVFGFTSLERGTPALGALSGEYLRPVPERRRFHVAFSVRSRGQSGGPVIDLRTQGVVGSVVGFRQDEQLTADVAALDQDTLSAAGVDLADLARQWRVRAAKHLCAEHPEFGVLGTEQFAPSLPDVHLADRPISREVLAGLLSGEQSVAYLHGPPGSGKTALALETANALRAQGRVDSMFWYDFEPHEHRFAAHLLRRLAAYLLHQDGDFEPLQACLADGFLNDQSDAVIAVTTALNQGRHVLVFDNVHFAQRDDAHEVMALVARITGSVRRGKTVALLASWTTPGSADHPVHDIDGLAGAEVKHLAHLHQVDLSPNAVEWVARFASDITCVEAFLRSPTWRAEVDAGQPQATEPVELHRHWLSHFLQSVSASGRDILLALSVLAQPSPRELVEEVASVSRFAVHLDQLLTSPPLVREDTKQFYLHFNVARAVIATSDRSDIIVMHERASAAYRQRGDRISSSRHQIDGGAVEDAVEQLFAARDEIISAGRVQDLEGLMERLRPLLPGLPGSAPLAHALLASCRNIRGDYRAATHHWGLALRQAPSDAMAALHNRKGDSHRLASDYHAARNAYELGAGSAREHTTDAAHRELGRAELGLAKLDRLRCSYAEARHHYVESRVAFESVFDELGIVEADFGLGEVSRLMGEWEAAITSYRSSLVKAQAVGSVEREAYAHWGLAEVHRLRGDHAAARGTHERGLALCVQVGDTRSEGWALLGLAETARAAGHTGFHDLYAQAHERFQRTGSTTEMAHALLGASEARRAAGEHDVAQYDEILDIYRSKNLRHCVVIGLLCQAAALRSAEVGATADEHLNTALEIAGECSLTIERALAERMLAESDYRPFPPLNFP
jgi:tetratricopeptide (TPR) repeat protein